MNPVGLSFVHRFLPAEAPDQPTLLLLHGTGGNEDDLLPLGRLLAPQAAMLSPRGQVLEQGMPRFFRRIAEGVFDVEDLKHRTADLADFVGEASQAYGFDPKRIVAAGFSNGANIASSLTLLRPGTLAGAVLFRAMVPFEPDAGTAIGGTRVFISNGRRDPLIPAEDTERLASLLRNAGADVTVAWQPGGHELTPADVTAARTWLSSGAPF